MGEDRTHGEGATRLADTDHSHLFPGARLSLGAAQFEPGKLVIRLSDGVEVDAELIRLDAASSWVLAVPEFTTTAGSTIPAKVWAVREFMAEGAGQILVIGARTVLTPVADEA